MHLVVPEAEIGKRLAERRDHYFAPSLAASQFAALEMLQQDEAGLSIVADLPLPVLIKRLLCHFTVN